VITFTSCDNLQRGSQACSENVRHYSNSVTSFTKGDFLNANKQARILIVVLIFVLLLQTSAPILALNITRGVDNPNSSELVDPDTGYTVEITGDKTPFEEQRRCLPQAGQ
jgi:hypothetical protein